MEKRIYTRRLAAYLFARGFKPIRTEPDARKEWYMNWFFEDSEELENAIGEYMLRAQ
ncbi:MAG: DUF5659 domain-containing protein [Oscillospiraceae bacterium]|jgi:hypothetical protein